MEVFDLLETETLIEDVIPIFSLPPNNHVWSGGRASDLTAAALRRMIKYDDINSAELNLEAICGHFSLDVFMLALDLGLRITKKVEVEPDNRKLLKFLRDRKIDAEIKKRRGTFELISNNGYGDDMIESIHLLKKMNY